jgi:hypothetical protein
MPIYTASSTTWPVLQTLDEVKHPSGLFTATATYIRPSGNLDFPETIPTSIGNLDLWPEEPTVSKDTSGFERLTATAYGIWDSTITQETTGWISSWIYGAARKVTYCTDASNTNCTCGTYSLPFDLSFSHYLYPIFAEYKVLKKAGSMPPIPTLALKRTTSQQGIENVGSITMSQLGRTIDPENFIGGNFGDIQPTSNPFISILNTFDYGGIIEYEVTYMPSVPIKLDYGTFTQIIPPGFQCL